MCVLVLYYLSLYVFQADVLVNVLNPKQELKESVVSKAFMEVCGPQLSQVNTVVNMDFCFVNRIESHCRWFVNFYFKKFKQFTQYGISFRSLC